MSIKSELDNTKYYLKESRKAILGRGGEISLSAGFKDLPEAIFNIPADSSLAFQTDDSVAYEKSVPSDVEDYALISKIGGMSYRTNNLLPFVEKTYESKGVTVTVGKDGIITLNGTATGGIATYTAKSLLLKANTTYCISSGSTGGSSTTYRMWCEPDVSGAFEKKYDIKGGTIITPTEDTAATVRIFVYADVTVTNVVFKPMLNEGDSALPYEPYFEGVRDTKVTALKVRGANIFNESAITHATPYKGTAAQSSYGVVNKEGGYLEARRASISDSVYWQPFCEHLTTGTYTISADVYIPTGKAPTLNVYMGLRSINDKTLFPASVTNLSANDVWERVNVQLSVKKEDDYLCVLQPTAPSAAQGVGLDVRFKNISIVKGTGTQYIPYNEYTFEIPEVVQGIEGYGQSNPDNAEEYNYIDSLNRQFAACGHIADGVWVSYEELKKTDISKTFPELSGFFKVEGNGKITFLNERNQPVPSTVKYTVKVGN